MLWPVAPCQERPRFAGHDAVLHNEFAQTNLQSTKDGRILENIPTNRVALFVLRYRDSTYAVPL